MNIIIIGAAASDSGGKAKNDAIEIAHVALAIAEIKNHTLCRRSTLEAPITVIKPVKIVKIAVANNKIEIKLTLPP